MLGSTSVWTCSLRGSTRFRADWRPARKSTRLFPEVLTSSSTCSTCILPRDGRRGAVEGRRVLSYSARRWEARRGGRQPRPFLSPRPASRISGYMYVQQTRARWEGRSVGQVAQGTNLPVGIRHHQLTAGRPEVATSATSLCPSIPFPRHPQHNLPQPTDVTAPVSECG